MIQIQKQFILDRVKTHLAKSHKVVYPPLPRNWAANLELPGISRANETAARAMVSTATNNYYYNTNTIWIINIILITVTINKGYPRCCRSRMVSTSKYQFSFIATH